MLLLFSVPNTDNSSLFPILSIYIILFKIFTLGVTSDNTFGRMYSIFFGIYMYELHIQFRKWVIQKPTIVNTGNKVDA